MHSRSTQGRLEFVRVQSAMGAKTKHYLISRTSRTEDPLRLFRSRRHLHAVPYRPVIDGSIFSVLP